MPPLGLGGRAGGVAERPELDELTVLLREGGFGKEEDAEEERDGVDAGPLSVLPAREVEGRVAAAGALFRGSVVARVRIRPLWVGRDIWDNLVRELPLGCESGESLRTVLPLYPLGRSEAGSGGNEGVLRSSEEMDAFESTLRGGRIGFRTMLEMALDVAAVVSLLAVSPGFATTSNRLDPAAGTTAGLDALRGRGGFDVEVSDRGSACN